MSCARNLGLTSLPIVCVSVEGFYDNFDAMLKRAYEEGLVKNKPEDGKQNNALGLGSQVPMDLIFFIFLLFFYLKLSTLFQQRKTLFVGLNREKKMLRLRTAYPKSK